MTRWGVVGGGVLGMTLAHRLRQRGQEVTLLEAGPSLGGLASAWSIGGLVWDRHYHVILLSDLRLRALLAELDLESETRWSGTKTGFYTDGRFHSMSNALEFLRFPPLDLIEKLRLAATILYASRIRNWRRLEDQAVTDWLGRWSGRGTCDKIWVPLLRAKLGDCYQRTSAAFIWATIARMYAARRGGLKKEMFGYVEGGYARILERFEERLRRDGIAIELDARIKRVGAGVERGVEILCADGRRLAFDRVVLTVPSPVAGALCPDLSAEEVGKLQDVEYLGIVCASLVLDRPLTPYYITNITDRWVPFSAVIEMTALVDPEEFGGKTLVYLPKYAETGAPIFERSDDDIREEFVAALCRMHPGLSEEDVLAFQVSRARHVFSLPTLGYSKRLPQVATSIPGLHILNSSHIVNGTLNVNETVRLAESALPSLLDDAADTEPPRAG